MKTRSTTDLRTPVAARTTDQCLKRTSGGAFKKPPVESNAWCYTSAARDVVFSYSWTIENFVTKMKESKNGESLTSETFNIEVDGSVTAWKLDCFPNGKEKVGEETKGHVSVFLYPANRESVNKPFMFALGFVDSDNCKVMKGKGSHCFKDNQNGWGWLRLISHPSLSDLSLKLLPQEKLHIFCVLKFAGATETYSGTSRPACLGKLAGGGREAEASDLEDEVSSDMYRLFETGEYSDVEVVAAGGRKFRCHRSVLSARSPVFRAALSHNYEENINGRLDIPDFDAGVVEDLLRHVYGGRIEELEDKAAELLAAGDKYDVQGLVRRCEVSLCNSLRINNCVDYLVLADLHSISGLRAVVFEFVAANIRELVSLPRWNEKLVAHPRLLAEVLQTVASEPPKKMARKEHRANEEKATRSKSMLAEELFSLIYNP